MRRACTAAVLLLVLSALLTVPHAVGAGSGFRYYQTQGRPSEPIRWNPCTPITYRINTNGLAGPASVRRVHSAISEAARASGIHFRFLGTTRAVPDNRRYPVVRSADADVVVTWAFRGAGARRSALLPRVARLAAVGGYSTVRSAQGFEVARSGFVVFDADRIFRMSARKQYLVALHELGHLLGLDDVRDGRQVMNAVVLDRGPSHYGAGDRAGLRRVGRKAGCLVPAPAPQRPTAARVGNQIRITTDRVKSVSGPVAYTLSSPELGGQVATGSTPEFSVQLSKLARLGLTSKAIRFQIGAANRVGSATSRPVVFQVPAAVLTAEPSLVVSPRSFEVVQLHAVMAGTTVDVTDWLMVSTDGSIDLHYVDGGEFETSFSQSIVMYGREVASYDVTGSIRVEGPGLDQSFDMTGTYLTGAVPDPPAEEPTEPPASPVE